MHGEEVINELGEEISKGKGCIVFDFACYFPYADQDFLIFKFKLGKSFRVFFVYVIFMK